MSESGPAAERVADRLQGLPWPALVVAGVGAFLAGYLLTVLLTIVGPSSVRGGVVGILTLLAFVFYSAHGVPVEVGGRERVDLLTRTASASTPEPAVPVIVFYAIPVVVLLAVALVVTVRVVDRSEDPVRVGAAVLGFAVSYGLAAIAGTLVFTTESVFGGSARLVLRDAALFGFAYPLVFGGVAAGLTGVVAYLGSEGVP